jgi:Rrf2 family transcriptional regulator, nitric oxide-sensitive transcriptional repressor
MLSQTAEYALRAMWYLARHRDEPQVISTIAQATEVSRDYLSKVLQQLVRGLLVRSRRGKGGGFVLARSPEAITLFDIVNIVSPIQRLTHCPLTNRAYCVNHEAGQPGLCPLHAAMDDAARKFERRLSAIRLTDLIRRIQSGSDEGHARTRPGTRRRARSAVPFRATGPRAAASRRRRPR